MIYKVQSINESGDIVLRDYHADDLSHAVEQHFDCFPEEHYLAVWEANISHTTTTRQPHRHPKETLMDPNEALRDLREALSQWHAAEDDDNSFNSLVAAENLAAAAEALDTWLSKSGFLPQD